jgi:hypothetical protein
MNCKQRKETVHASVYIYICHTTNKNIKGNIICQK